MNDSNNSNVFICRFCNQPLDTEEVSLNTISTSIECYNHTHDNIYAILYRFKLHDLTPYLYTIDIYLTTNLLLRYFAPLYGLHSECIWLYEKNKEDSRDTWQTLTDFPLTLINKSLSQIVEKINALKPFI